MSSPLLLFRSLAFNALYWVWTVCVALAWSPAFLFWPKATQHVGRPWARGVFALARALCGIKYEIRGEHHFVPGAALYASKHQSAWDTIVFLCLCDRPVYVLKRELLRIPFFGWYLWRMQMIAIDRKAGAGAVKQIVREAHERLADGRPIVIFPEGTRTRPGASPAYQPGVAALYRQMNMPVIPVALNSGLYWGRNAFVKRAGTVIIEFLPPIEPGLGSKAFMARLERDIETASQRLLNEGTVQDVPSLKKK